MTRLLALALALLALALAPGARAHGAAQDDHAAAELAAYPELLIRVTNEAIEAPATVTAGRYRVVLENASVPGPDAFLEESHLFIQRVPDEVPESELVIDEEAEGDPEWFWDSTFVGNPNRAAPNGGWVEGLVDLPVGRYLVVAPVSPELWPVRIDVVAPSDGAASPVPADEPAAAVRVGMRETAFDMPDALSAGHQLWRVENTGQEMHELAVFPVPTGATQEQTVAAMLAFFEGGDPGEAAGPAWDGWRYEAEGGVGLTSPGQASWAAIDLEPGTYAVADFFPGTDEGPNLLAGMLKVVTVGADAESDAATPAAAAPAPISDAVAGAPARIASLHGRDA